ncbi:2-octaprenyl-6-methoxyphenyl hydroxylase [Thioflexithrix psekupsensis]|uniref:2-octaprenyl-6-methoxyphenyl hydroxylase n=1 Tax=Thioflexithrix psekupsensis TaxID=1570016 RepID=A0A251XBK0_9GAMM|nr:2-octaprenyl-6-methoxyphenyl hydroxylase [Thioflexithrix psekupsensis]OUD15295.1 2-octaprenyl-6-methoxyphenyl hydroxylase [Thioflexithrix psekupsensis]
MNHPIPSNDASHKTTPIDYDVLIVGAGLVGASLAVALRNSEWRVGLIEASAWTPQHLPAGYDDRIIALNYGSQRILSGLGVWHHVAKQSTAIHCIHVSDRGHFGAAHLTRQQLGLPALGYTVSARVLGQSLQQAVYQYATTQLFPSSQLQHVQDQADYLAVTLQNAEQTRTLCTRLLVLADGGNFALQEQLGIQHHIHDYQQTAVIATVTVSSQKLSTETVAYERFTATGPLALLPLAHQDYSLVWTVPSAQATEVLHLSDKDFLIELQKAFGWRAGRFIRVSPRRSYPLKLAHVHAESIPNRTVIIGNAAHTLHPIAGQGLNLGLRDVASLTEAIGMAQQEGIELGSADFLRAYHNWQQPDQQRMIRLTDSLVTLFSNENMLLSLVRNMGLVALNHFPPLKQWLMTQMIGLHGHQSHLLRGLPPSGTGEKNT